MAEGTTRLDVAFEVGAKRTFAAAVEWPGWCRSGRDERAALESLLAYGPRYAQVLRGTRLGYRAPGRRVDVRVTERVPGNATTDFGAPDAALALDARPMPGVDVRRLSSILRASWRTLDRAAGAARGTTLRPAGPRGGGRSAVKVLEHVRGAEEGYLASLGWKPPKDALGDDERLRAVMLEGLAASARGEIPERGPRGGRRWTARYFARREAWHVLDHAWEIEDRTP
jgi:hypothetical protein